MGGITFGFAGCGLISPYWTPNEISEPQFAAKLDALSPLKVLGRGYSVVKSEDGRVLARASDVELGEKISVRLSEGALHCVVEGRS